MAKALLVDVGHRVVAAIAEGMSRRQAAARFGVSAASAVRWHQRFSRRVARLRRAGRAGIAAPVGSRLIVRSSSAS
jgi:transposase